jgi:vacuolar protein sorting-associated protein 51
MATITSPRPDPVQRITSPSIPSTSDTPSSSLRPSLETPRPANPSSPAVQQNATPAVAQRRNRAALRDYYNLKSKAASSATASPDQREITRSASITSVASDSTITSAPGGPDSTTSPLTAQLDDPSFTADTYVAELLKTASLRDLLKTESALVSEVRNLDGERKALVYDNYSKLIKAVGTIAEMQKGMHKGAQQDRFAGMLGERKTQGQPAGLDGVKEVGEQLDGLLRIMKELNPGAKDRVKEVGRASRLRRQQESVRWTLDAPERLRRLLDEGRREEAERLYVEVLDLLRRWKSVGGVDELRRDCAEVMSSAREETGEQPGEGEG